MENKKNKKEELQSRRQFFRKAAQATLPMIGAIVLSQVPTIMKAQIPNGCRSACMGSCSGLCYQSCYDTCNRGCEGCRGTCNQSCSSTCTQQCQNACKVGCSYSSLY